MVSSELSVKMLFASIVVAALLQSNTFCTLPTDDENVSDRKENERETNRKSHPAIHDEIYEEIMNCLRSKLMLRCRHIMSNNEKNLSGSIKRYMNMLALTIQFMVVEKIVLSQQMKKIQK